MIQRRNAQLYAVAKSAQLYTRDATAVLTWR